LSSSESGDTPRAVVVKFATVVGVVLCGGASRTRLLAVCAGPSEHTTESNRAARDKAAARTDRVRVIIRTVSRGLLCAPLSRASKSLLFKRSADYKQQPGSCLVLHMNEVRP
jgi:hypothetical protein